MTGWETRNLTVVPAEERSCQWLEVLNTPGYKATAAYHRKAREQDHPGNRHTQQNDNTVQFYP